MDETPNQEVTTGQAPGNKWRTVVVAAALVIVLGTAATCFLFHRSASGAQNKAEAEPQAKCVMHLDPFVANLSDAGGDCFLQVGIELGLDREADQHGHPAQAAMSPAGTRDTILSISATCNAEALVSPNGNATLKERSATVHRERAPELGVREIYFTEFLVQR